MFPQTKIEQNKHRRFAANGLHKKHWSSTNPIREIFKKAFINAGLDYFNPHSFRNTLAQLGQRLCITPEEIKAWSQSLGHDNVLTTFTSYGELSPQREKEVFASLKVKKEDSISIASIESLEAKLDKLIIAQELR